MEELRDPYAGALERNQSRQLEVANLATVSQPVHANPAKRPRTEGGSEQSMQMFLSLGERMCTLTETIQRSMAPTTTSAKEPASEDKEEDEENHVFQQTVNVFDDGVMNLNLELRHALRVPNRDPEGWWAPPFSSRVSKPIRGHSLYLESCLGPSNRVNELVLRKLHDRSAPLVVKGLITKNSSFSGPMERTHVIGVSSGDQVSSYSSRQKWKEADSPWEVVDAVINLLASTHMIRSYSHEAIALISVLHQCRYFFSVVNGDREKQRTLLNEFVQSVFNRNQERSKTGYGPLKYSAILNLAKELTARHGLNEARLMTGDCYSGKLPEADGTAKTLKTMQDKIDRFEKALAQKDGQRGASSSGRGRGNSSRGGRNRGKNSLSNNNMSTADQQKMKMICWKYNQPTGCSRQNCTFFHLCRKLLPNGVCGQAHPSTECPN